MMKYALIDQSRVVSYTCKHAETLEVEPRVIGEHNIVGVVTIRQ